jgi:Lipocalin-like domain
MSNRYILASSLAFGIGCLASHAFAQTAADLAGRWTLVSNTIEQDGKAVDNFGPTPKGLLMLDSAGYFIILNGRSDLPKIASGTRISGTPEENKAIVQGSIGLYGTYTVDAANKTLTFKIDYSTFPNWNGDVQKRPFSLSGDKLTWTVPAASTGRGAAHLVWQRAK